MYTSVELFYKYGEIIKHHCAIPDTTDNKSTDDSSTHANCTKSDCNNVGFNTFNTDSSQQAKPINLTSKK